MAANRQPFYLSGESEAATPSSAPPADRAFFSHLGDIALAHAAQGFRVHPLIPNTKLPLLNAWPKRATMDAMQIREWWTRWPDANIGVLCGDGLVVVDIDRHGDVDGYETLQDLPELPATLTVATPGHGEHRYYRAEDVPSRTLAGIDIKARGGYVVGAGSVIDGKEYRVTGSEGVQALPAAIASILSDGPASMAGRSEVAPQSGHATAIGPDGSPSTRRCGIATRLIRDTDDTATADDYMRAVIDAGLDERGDGRPWTAVDCERDWANIHKQLAIGKLRLPRRMYTRRLPAIDIEATWQRLRSTKMSNAERRAAQTMPNKAATGVHKVTYRDVKGNSRVSTKSVAKLMPLAAERIGVAYVPGRSASKAEPHGCAGRIEYSVQPHAVLAASPVADGNNAYCSDDVHACVGGPRDSAHSLTSAPEAPPQPHPRLPTPSMSHDAWFEQLDDAADADDDADTLACYRLRLRSGQKLTWNQAQDKLEIEARQGRRAARLRTMDTGDDLPATPPYDCPRCGSLVFPPHDCPDGA